MSDKKHSFQKTITGAVISIVILVAAGLLYMNRQYAIDQVVVWGYTPTASIKTIEDRIDLTGKGQFYFYATQPEVANADQFNKDCPRQEVGNPILGCYSAGRIYIYDIDNAQLDGIEEVTSAHEMLHSAWDRMSPEDQEKIGTLLKTEYLKRSQNDTDFVERIQYYQRTEPGEFLNELHSILGTENSTLDPELETYYKKYFNDRQKIVALHQKYDSVFKNVKKQSETLYNELTALGKTIDTRTNKYNDDVKELSVDIEAFNTRANNGGFASINQFNNERAALVARSNQLDADRAAISTDIDTYNTKYTEYETLSSQIEVLNKSIDSFNQLQPTPSVNN